MADPRRHHASEHIADEDPLQRLRLRPAPEPPAVREVDAAGGPEVSMSSSPSRSQTASTSSTQTIMEKLPRGGGSKGAAAGRG